MNAAWFGVGLLTGIVIGAGVMYHISENEQNERIDELAAERDALFKEVRSFKRGSKPFEEKEEKEEKEPQEEVDVPKLSRKYRDPDFDKHFGDRDHPREDPPAAGPFRVSEAEYESAFDSNGGGKESLTYYQQDGVLADDRDEVISHPREVVGEVLDELSGTEEDTIFVRNEELDSWYEVSVEHSLAYYRDVLGES